MINKAGKVMKRIRQGEGFIGVYHHKGDKFILYPLFRYDSGPIEINPIPEAEEADIVRVWSENGDTFASLFHKKETLLYRYFMELNSLRINPFFPQEALEEVKAILENPGIDDSQLLDYTDLPFVTIDNEGSRDLDQAIYVEDYKSGFKIYYAIADASYYIKPGSALFTEALRRGASYYFPDYSVPMLPRELSEGIISLNPMEPRRCLMFLMEVDQKGIVVKTDIFRAKIISRAKLSYPEVQRFYDGEETSFLDEPFSQSLFSLEKVGALLAERGDDRGIISYQRHENEIHISEDGTSLIVKGNSRNNASRWNEQISILCNLEGAKILSDVFNSMHIQPIFRVHDAPTEESLKHLELVIADFIKIHNLDETVFSWKREESLSSYLKRLHASGESKRIIDAIERQILISNNKSYFTDMPGSHFALGAKFYGRFSSPMREIVGIFTHKELTEKLGMQKPLPDEEDIELRKKVILASNRSKDIQKEIDNFVNSLVIESLFKEDLMTSASARRVHKGTILGMKDSKLYVLLDDPAIEIKIYMEDIERFFCQKFIFKSYEMVDDENNPSIRIKAGSLISFRLHSFHKDYKWRFTDFSL